MTDKRYIELMPELTGYKQYIREFIPHYDSKLMGRHRGVVTKIVEVGAYRPARLERQELEERKLEPYA